MLTTITHAAMEHAIRLTASVDVYFGCSLNSHKRAWAATASRLARAGPLLRAFPFKPVFKHMGVDVAVRGGNWHYSQEKYVGPTQETHPPVRLHSCCLQDSAWCVGC